MRDLVVFGVVMVALPMAFRRPFIGLLLFSWLAYMRPQDLCWGFARNMRFSFFVALVMLVGWFVNEAQARPFWRRDPRTVLMFTLAVLVTIGLTMAESFLSSEYVTRYYLEFVKIIVIALFTTGQVDTKQRLRMLLWTIALCFAFFGFKGGLFGVLSGGSTINRGPGGMLEDNNDFALALVMSIPLIFYMAQGEDNALIKRAGVLCVMGTLVTILLTHSRGGFLAATVTLLIMAWRSQKLIQAGAVLVLMVIAFFCFAPESVFERIGSIQEGGEEASAGARLKAWGIALQMIRDHPVFGVGLRNFRQHYVRYSDPLGLGDEAKVAHNSYLQIWAEGGTVTFVVYLVLLFSVFLGCMWLRRVARAHPHVGWAAHYARMFEATTAGFMVGAVFLNRGHFDLIYHWIALLSCTMFIVRREALQGPAPAAEGAAAGAAVPGPRPAPRVRWGPVVPGSLLPRWGR